MWNQLDEAGLLHDVGARVRAIRNIPREAVELPGFHLFTRDGLCAPYSWLVPKPKGDDQDLLQMWEAYGNGQHGDRRSRADPLLELVENTSFLGVAAHQRFFGKGARLPTQWATPAAKIIALAQHFEGQENMSIELGADKAGMYRQGIAAVQIHLGEFFLRVTPKSMFSNFQGKEIEYSYKASDCVLDEMCIRPLRTSNALAVALMQNEEMPECVLQMANVAVRALHLGQLLPTDFTINLSKHRSPNTNDIVQDAKALLQSDPLHALSHLYPMLVPALMGKEQFATTFGSPHQHRKIAKTQEATRNRWLDELSKLAA